MDQYKHLVQEVLYHGNYKPNRTGVGTYSTFNWNYEIDLQEGFPLLTTKKVNWKNIVIENLWFLSGKEHIDFLHKHGCKFWNPWADENKAVPSAYGNFWRNFPGNALNQNYRGQQISAMYMVDQVDWVLNELRNNPFSRRLIVSAWHPANATHSKLPPCHFTWGLNVQNDRKGEKELNLHLTQRSCDIALGLPYNIAGYALLLELFSLWSDIPACHFGHSIIDAHIYENHMDGLREQIKRPCLPLPKLQLDAEALKYGLRSIEEIVEEATTEEILEIFKLENYQHHDPIKFEVAV